MVEDENTAPDQGGGNAEGVPTGPCDASVRFSMTKDGMKVGISRYSPPSGGGRALTPEAVARQMLKAGINAQMNREAVVTAIDLLNKGEDARKVVIARGKKPSSGKDAELDLYGDFNFPTYPGMVIGALRPARAPQAGHTVDGRPVDPDPGQPTPRSIAVNGLLAFNPEDGSLTAQAYGMIRYTGEEIRLDPIMVVSKDALQVTGEVYHKDYLGNPLNEEEVAKDLKRLDVALPLRRKTFAAAVRAAAEEKRPVGAVLVKGKSPENGKDGWLEVLVQDRTGIGSEKDGGRIDFRNKGIFPTVEPGMVIATLHPPTKGLPGTDVLGRLIPPREGREFPVTAGENVEFDEESNVFKAQGTGMMVNQNGVLIVTDFLEIRGDVNYASGNITVDRGSVKVKGSVLSGFSVDCPGNVVVGEVIEDADVKSGKDVCVMGGILMKEGGLIKAGGSVTAQFANNAFIKAGGDVDIANNVSNCIIQAGGAVYADKGKGIIMGGKITAGSLVVANEIGSEIGVQTHVTISIKNVQNVELIRERLTLKSFIKKVTETLGCEPAETILNRTPAEKKEKAAVLLQKRDAATKRLKAVEETLDKERQERMRLLEKSRVVVKGKAYPGTIIKIGGRVIQVKSVISSSKFYYDPTSRELVAGSL